jgi:uncharacterized membrane protein
MTEPIDTPNDPEPEPELDLGPRSLRGLGKGRRSNHGAERSGSHTPSLSHSHVHSAEDVEVPGPTRKLLLGVVLGLGALLVAATAITWPSDIPRFDMSAFGSADGVFSAEVMRAVEEPCPTTFDNEGEIDEENQLLCSAIEVQFLEGPDEGETKSISITDSGVLPEFNAGERLHVALTVPVACREENLGADLTVSECLDGLDPNIYYAIDSRDRTTPLLLLALLFAAVVIALGRWRGLLSLVGLGASLLVLIVYVLPGILSGTSPLVIALIGAALIAYLALYLAHGFNPLTHVALIGTLGSLVLVAVLAQVFVGAAKLSGFTDESAVIVRAFGANIQFSGLVLAGTIIGALGAIDDMTVTQAASVLELRRANSSLGIAELYRRSLRIGRDHIASTVNTLVLAYAGGSLALLVMFTQLGTSGQNGSGQNTLGRVLTSEVIATELVKTLVGSIGLVASVPVTTWLAAWLVTRTPVGLQLGAEAAEVEAAPTE